MKTEEAKRLFEIEKLEEEYNKEIEECLTCRKVREEGKSDACDYHWKRWMQIVGKKEVLETIKSACEFWLRYVHNPNLLKKEHPEIYKKFTAKELEKNSYIVWLFKVAFRDVMK